MVPATGLKYLICRFLARLLLLLLCPNAVHFFSPGGLPLVFTRRPPQTVNGWIFHAARAPNETQFENIMEINVKPFKPAAYDALMAFDRKRWAHHAGPADTVIGDQTTSNPVEQNMSMIGAEVCLMLTLSFLYFGSREPRPGGLMSSFE